jgi:hypothetical protein
VDSPALLGRDARGVEQAHGVAGGPVAMVVDLADAFTWVADIVAPRGHGKAFLVDSDRVLGCQLAGRVPDAVAWKIPCAGTVGPSSGRARS